MVPEPHQHIAEYTEQAKGQYDIAYDLFCPEFLAHGFDFQVNNNSSRRLLSLSLKWSTA